MENTMEVYKKKNKIKNDPDSLLPEMQTLLTLRRKKSNMVSYEYKTLNLLRWIYSKILQNKFSLQNRALEITKVIRVHLSF